MSGYSTEFGRCICGDSLIELSKLADSSIDLVVTSPPFALQRKNHMGMKIKIIMSIGYASLQH